MATLVVIGYPDQGVAEDARKSVQQLEDELTIEVDHVASIARDVQGRYHAHISHSRASAGGGVDWGQFWGALFGLLFFRPAGGPALISGIESLPSELGESGIAQSFHDQVRKQVKPGTSAVFMMIEDAPPNRAFGALTRYGGTMLQTSLSDAVFEQLRESLRTPTSGTLS